ncbi:Kelch repeat-containing protein [Cystobacter fuscus]|uniref:Kelch repeat-containing protein n=1 Tax=Cystobacter fuscus TaxID=43 RepID=UPI0037C083FF
MRIVNLTTSLAVALLFPACGGPAAEEPSQLAIRSGELSSAPAASLAALADLEPQSVGSWSLTGDLTSAHSGHTATLLSSGKVLVVSGTTAEVFNPYSNVSVATGSPYWARTQHTATRLESGNVLVAGGWIGKFPLYWRHSAEVYDKKTGTWSSADSMSVPRGNHTATLLGSDKVLVVGGDTTDGLNPEVSLQTDSVDLYDPATNTWSPAASIFMPRAGHTATLLYSGEVLVTGGRFFDWVLQDAQVYDPDTDNWSMPAPMPRARTGHVAVRLNSGKVMVLGGGHDEVDFYDPYSSTTPWTTGPSLPSGGTAISATRLYSGEVLVTHSTGQASLYDPATDAWLSAGTLPAPVSAHAATLLHTGQVLVTGGSSGATVQRYTR